MEFTNAERALLRDIYDGPESPVPSREMSVASTSTLLPFSASQSRNATPLMGRATGLLERTSRHPEPEHDEMDIDMPDIEEPSEPPIIVATDFGTTFSAVAYAKREENNAHPRIKIIANYPDDPRAMQGKPGLEVPTESWYPNKAQMAEVIQDTEMTTANDPGFDDQYDASDQDVHDIWRISEDDSSDENDELVPHPLPVDNEIRNFFWGYGIQKLTAPDLIYRDYNRIARSKLLLDRSTKTQKVRDQLRPVLTRLKRSKKIREDEDVIADYLTQLFLHTKEQLRSSGISNASPIEHVLCVPVVWKPQALRKMQKAMATAIRKSEFGSIDNLFLVSEAEAAAAYVLGKSDEVQSGEAFVIVDAGGGTVDVTTYKVDNRLPLRLSEELVDSDGDLLGSSYLNEAFKDHLMKRLKDETHLECAGYTIQGIVDAEAVKFENKTKRTLDVTDKRMPTEKIIIQGLKEDQEKGFANHRVLMKRRDFIDIFAPRLEAIANMVVKQLTEAEKKGHRVQKVVLVGGFSGSPSLRNYMKGILATRSQAVGYQIRLIEVESRDPETAVAQGALLRAWNKEDGPKRKIKSSYGFLRDEPHCPEKWEGSDGYIAHNDVRPTINKFNGEKYVRGTIEWLVKAGDDVDFRAEYAIPSHHIFAANRKYFKCEEVLYVSDTARESHYRHNHSKNKGAEKAGVIIVDMSDLVHDGKIPLVVPKPGTIGEKHYDIEFELVMIIEGRNLRYEVRWPAGGGVVKGRGDTSIAAAFRPGTK